MKKKANKAERKHMCRVSELGCVVCTYHLGLPPHAAEVHHLKDGHGSMRAPHYETIGLCDKHHRTGGPGIALHAGVETWERKYGTQREYLALVLKELGIDDDSTEQTA